jgi:hypothetical protein
VNKWHRRVLELARELPEYDTFREGTLPLPMLGVSKDGGSGALRSVDREQSLDEGQGEPAPKGQHMLGAPGAGVPSPTPLTTHTKFTESSHQMLHQHPLFSTPPQVAAAGAQRKAGSRRRRADVPRSAAGWQAPQST